MMGQYSWSVVIMITLGSNMILFWNIIFYFIYRAINNVFLFFIRINPLMFLYRSPYGKKHFENMGIEDPMGELNKAFERPDIGLSIMYAGGVIYFLLVMLIFGFINYFSALVTKETDLQFYHFFIFLCLSFILNHFLLFRKDKYLKYFKKIKKMNKKEKILWAWITFFVVMGILIFVIGSFVAMSYQIKD